jgi:hypothetical protein
MEQKVYMAHSQEVYLADNNSKHSYGSDFVPDIVLSTCHRLTHNQFRR